MSTTNDKSSTVFTMTRVFEAPLDRVWKAWSDAEQLARWWGPAGCKVEIKRLEFQPGGFCHYSMNFPGMPSMWGRFNFREIVAPSRIVWLNSFANEDCGIARAPFSEDCPLEIENTVTLTEKDGVTTIDLRARAFGATAPERKFFDDLTASMEQGYGGTFDQLKAHLAKG
ncbi:SRPBCC domain-containing protein [soil metagenome]